MWCYVYALLVNIKFLVSYLAQKEKEKYTTLTPISSGTFSVSNNQSGYGGFVRENCIDTRPCISRKETQENRPTTIS